MYQPTDDELFEVARKLALCHAKRKDEGHLDFALYFPLAPDGGIPKIGLVEVISDIPIPRRDPYLSEPFEFSPWEVESFKSGKRFACIAAVILYSPEQWGMMKNGDTALPEEWSRRKPKIAYSDAAMHMHGSHTIRQDAENIVRAHRDIDGGGLEKAVLFPSDNATIMLMEVIYGIAPGDIGKEPEVYGFDKESGDIGNRKDGIQHPMKLFLLSAAEWDWVQHGKMPLPEGWNLSQTVKKFSAKH